MPDFSILSTLANPQLDHIVGQLPNSNNQSQSSNDGLGGIGALLKGLGGLIGGNKTPTNNSTPSQPQNTPNNPQMGLMASNLQNPQTPAQNMTSNNYGLGSIVHGVDSNLKSGFDPFKIAQPYMGMNVNQNNDTIKAFLNKSGQNINPANIPWCARFVNSVLQSSGMKGTGSLAARSFLNYGTPTQAPNRGDIVVYSDLTGNNNPEHGHVGFYAGTDKNGNILTLGGNESHGVAIKAYPASKVLGYRRPPNGDMIQQNIAPPNASPELSHTMAGISSVESQGDYNLVGKATKKGDRALGKYQIMNSNLPAWSTEALGHPVTKQQFLKDPAIQEKVAAYQINKYLQNGATPQDAASMWFTGRPLSKVNMNVKDAYGTSNTQYQKKFNQGYLKSKAQSSAIGPMTQNTKGFNPIPQPPINPSTSNDIEPPIIKHEDYENMIRQLDQGHEYEG